MDRIFEVVAVIITLFRIPIFIVMAIVIGVIIFVRKKSLMIKMLMFIFVMVIVSLFLFIQGDSRIYETVRGLTIVVVDKETGEFLSDIVVYYQIEKGQLLPSLCSTAYSIVEEKYVTNKGGICKIPKHRYWKWPKIQWTQHDIIAVNLDVIDEIKKQEGEAKGFWKHFNVFEMGNYELFYRKNSKYRGQVILFSRDGFTDLEGKHIINFRRYDLIYMDLRDKDDIIIVKLEQNK